jgi:hypothetical protein
MRRFAVTAFAVLYGVLILSASVIRSNDWLAREAPAFGHPASGHSSPSFAKVGKSDTYLPQKRIVERGFAVESPLEQVGVYPTCSMSHIPPLSVERPGAWLGEAASSRPPPFLI